MRGVYVEIRTETDRPTDVISLQTMIYCANQWIDFLVTAYCAAFCCASKHSLALPAEIGLRDRHKHYPPPCAPLLGLPGVRFCTGLSGFGTTCPVENFSSEPDTDIRMYIDADPQYLAPARSLKIGQECPVFFDVPTWQPYPLPDTRPVNDNVEFTTEKTKIMGP